ncbi:MAG TPA: indolepyruvate ferredoxin oxidoreductase subunit alpha [Euryarchaeota archaeon]|nr:indolepyruvate ferredoxin oxidoreductase subunit alpha [Euryarchaeota archaeon]
MRSILEGGPGDVILLLGNEAAARGAIEAGIAIATTYPGTPASEITDSLIEPARELDVAIEYSVNEKIALETALGASLSGLRALVSMKHVGANVASDALLTLTYTGIKGGLVIVVADDPGCYSSQNEQDSRFYARFAGAPMLEPSSPQECLDMVRYAFEMSEQLGLPVLVRTTTNISHTTGAVRTGDIQEPERNGEFDKSDRRLSLPSIARKSHADLLARLRKAEEISEKSPFNRRIVVGDRIGLGIISSSAGFNYAMDSAIDLPVRVEVMKLGQSFPLPKKRLERFMRSKERILVVEELEPILETEVKALAYDRDLDAEIFGKGTGRLSRVLDYNHEIVSEAIELAFFGRAQSKSRRDGAIEQLPPRSPVLCPGCPHSALYYAVKMATKGNAVFANDIGCYSLGALSPIDMGDTMLCMGASVGIASGLSLSQKEKVIAFIGDSTLFHSGIPSIVNAVHHGHDLMLIVLDNMTTAMTGHQPHPGVGRDAFGEEAQAVSIEKIIEGCGIDDIRVVDPYDIDGTVGTVREMLEKKGISVIISRRRCTLLEVASRRSSLGEKRHIDQEKCRKCGTCIDAFTCPAIFRDNENYGINDILCIGCGVCDKVCPSKAIGVGK